MPNTTKAAPPNSMILIADPSGGEIPDWDGRSLLEATDSCIIVGCLMDADGDTEFTLGRMREVDPGDRLIFQGKLKTPNYRIALRSVLGQVILEAAVLQPTTEVRIWANHPTEPDRVIVGIE